MGLRNLIASTAAAVAVAFDPKRLLDGLNPEQAEAVTHFEGPILVAAVAGAGKTRALVHRIAYLVSVHQVNPNRILAVTFSKKGADEMNERLESLLPDSGARVGTFHSVAYEILRVERPEMKNWTVDDKDKFKFCIKDAAGYKGMDWKGCDVTLTAHFVSYCKAQMWRPFSEGAMAFAQDLYVKHGPKAHPRMLNECYKRADALRVERQLLGFDDMMLDTAEMLQADETIRTRWASKWDFVLQDEAQDQNRVQLVMGELLAKDHRNYLLVGDPAQAIYGFRGAMPSMLLSFEERWGAKVVKMGRNYRCGQKIIDAANRSLDAMDPSTRLDMHMICEKGVDGTVTSTLYTDQDQEGEALAAQIAELIHDGAEPKSVAVLYRTNAMSRAPEEALIGARIPYRIIGGTNFYERKEVRDLLAYLRVCEGRGDLDDVARCINAPFRFLGKAFVDKVREAAKAARAQARKTGLRVNWPAVVRAACDREHVQARQRNSAEEWADLMTECSDRIEAQRKMAQPQIEMAPTDEGIAGWDDGKPVNVLEHIILATGYTQWLVKDEGEESTENSRVSNVREMVRASRRFPTVKELLDYIDEIIAASRSQRNGETPNKVTLTSCHRSKGMEWPHVFVIGVNDDIMPHRRAEDVEEERRIFYVAITRAKERLAVSCVTEIAIGDKVRPVAPSPFLMEAGLAPVDETVESDGVEPPPGTLLN